IRRMAPDRGQAGRYLPDLGGHGGRIRRYVDAGTDQDAMPMRRIHEFGQDSAPLAALDLPLVLPAGAQCRPAKPEPDESLDHRDRRRQGELRLRVARDAMRGGVDGQGEGEAPGVRPPRMVAATSAARLPSRPDAQWEPHTSSAHQLSGAIAGGV